MTAGRPSFPAKSREDAENFFLSSLQQWREAMHVDKMVLVGHSLGGYLAASYALQYPQHVQHLVLVCPAGVVSRPACAAQSVSRHPPGPALCPCSCEPRCPPAMTVSVSVGYIPAECPDLA